MKRWKWLALALVFPAAAIATMSVFTLTAELGARANDEGGVDIRNDEVRREPTRLGLSAWSATTALPEARKQAATVAYNGFVYALGGETLSGPTASIVQATLDGNGAVGAWTAAAVSLPEPRSQLAAVAYGGFLYVVGGKASGSGRDDVLVSPIAANGALGPFVVSPVTVPDGPRYGHVAAAWGGYLFVHGGGAAGLPTLADVKFAPINADGTLGAFGTAGSFGPKIDHALVAHRGGLYLVGGDTGSGQTSGVYRLEIDSSNGHVGPASLITTLPSARGRAAAAISGGAMYVVGGVNAAGTYLSEVLVAPLLADGTLPAFTPTLALAGAARAELGLVAYDGSLFALGGGDASTPFADVVSATLVRGRALTGAFTVSPGLTGARTQAGVAVAGKVIYLAGGANSNVPLSTVERVPLTATGGTGTPVAATPLAVARQNPAAVVVDGFFYVIGGRDSTAGDLASSERVSLSLDGTLQGGFSSASLGALNFGRNGHAAAVAHGRIYVSGGKLNALTRTDVEIGEIVSPNTLVWSVSPSAFTLGRTLHASVAHAGHLYLIGGQTMGGSTADIQVATIDPTTGALGAFTSTTPLPSAAQGVSATVLEGHLYVAGVGATTAIVSAPINADGSLGTFVTVASPPSARSGAALVAGSTGLHLLGGTDGSTFSETNSVYALTLGTLTGVANPLTLAVALPSARYGHDTVAYRDRLYVTGGNPTGAEVAFASVQPGGVLSSFNQTSAYSGARSGPAAVAYRDFFYVLGGENAGATLSDVQVAPINADGTLGVFTGTTPLPTARSGLAATAWNGRLYVAGGSEGGTGAALTNDVYVASINADGSLGAFTPTTSFTTARYQHRLLAYGGRLYVVAGNVGGTGATDVQAAAINADGTVGPFTRAGTLPFRLAAQVAAVRDGYLYLAGGGPASPPYAGVLAAPFDVNGNLGAFRWLGDLPNGVSDCSGALAQGRLFVTGGYFGSPQIAVRSVDLRAAPSKGSYSKLVDLSVPSTLVSITPNGTALKGSVSLDYRVASPSGVFGPRISKGLIPVGSATSLTGSNVRWVWLKLDFDDTLAATLSPDVPSERDVADLTVVHNPDPTLSPGNSMIPPRTALTFTCSGGAGGPYTLALAQNQSSATFTPGTGAYVAGSTGNTVDLVTCTDSAGAVGQTRLSIGPGVFISTASTTVAPRDTRTLTAGGGSAMGYVFSYVTNASGGSLTPAGAYQAGPTGSVADVVRCTDSLGNVGTLTLNVTASLALSPLSATVPPRGAQTFTTTGGSATGIVYALSQSPSGATIGAGTGQYTAGATPNVTDVVQATDSLSNTATANVTVGPGVSIAPNGGSAPPRGTLSFTAMGGSNAGFTWRLTSNASGGDVDAGSYRAGATGGVTDIAEARDSLGNSASVSITVGAGVSISPGSAALPPRGTQGFTAMGGSGSGFTFTGPSLPSGGMVTPGGAYTAGPNGPANDLVRVTDSLGNTATVNVAVGPQISIAPASASTPPSGTIAFTATLGSGTGYAWSIATAGSGSPTVGAGDGSYRAGTQMGTDVVRVTDSLGNTATVNITVTNALAVSPGAVMVAPREALQLTGSGGSQAGYVWSLLTNASGATFNPATQAYVAGPLGGVTDVVQLRDSLNNTATATLTVKPGVTLTPVSVTLPPRGAQTFVAAGGTNLGFTWSVMPNGSGATVDGGAYLAGATGAVTDTVIATDSLGNAGTATVTVTPGLTISPSPLSIAPRDTQPLAADGGSRVGYAWSFVTNASTGTLNPGTGVYRAGATGAVVDTVEVRDSLGNSAQLAITVRPGISITPDAGTVAPRGTLQLLANGGSESGFTWTLTANRSGATLSPSNGLYRAGGTASVVDEVLVVDSLGNSGTAQVLVGAAIAITPANPTVVPLETVGFVAMGGGGGNDWRLISNGSGATLDMQTGRYVAGSRGGTTDTVQVTDVLGNVATTVVTVKDALRLSPNTLSLSPRGTQTFTAMGGSGMGYAFSLAAGSGSGGSIDAQSGAYAAGPVGNTVDLVQVRDSVSAVATVMVMVGDGLTISPRSAEVAAGGTQTFNVTGGSGQGYAWALSTNASGGSIVPASGAYAAGATGNVTDDVQVTDSLGNTAVAHVTVVGGGGSVVPARERPAANGWSCGCQSGAPGFGLLGLALLALRRRRWGRFGGSVTLAVLLVASLASAAAAKPKKKKAPAPAAVTTPAPATPAAVVEPAPEPKPVEPGPTARPAPAAPPAPAVKRKPTVAVIEVDVTAQGERLDAAAFSDMMVTAIDSRQAFIVVSSKDIAAMLGIERQKQLLGCSDDTSCMSELANALGTDFVMLGSVGKVGDSYLVSTRLVEAARSKVTARASVQAKSPNALLEAIWRATQQTLDGYGESLPSPEAERWAARPKPEPPATLTVAEETPSRFGLAAAAVLGWQPLSVAGKRGSVGAQVDLTFRRGRLELAAGVVIAPSPGARITFTWALLDARTRIDLGIRGTAFPGAGLYGGGVTAGFEFALNDHFGLNARVAGEVYPAAGSVIFAMLGAAGVSVRF
ncbi:MAG: hypothetical protein IPJ65_08625 [Archangiaceae bacterium]|nr:hypothetical protein [Archangiaceae bacterium]